MPRKATLQELLYTDNSHTSVGLIQAVLRQNAVWPDPPLVRVGAETPPSWCSAGTFAPAPRLDVEWPLGHVPEGDWRQGYGASNADARLTVFPEAFWSAPPSYSKTQPLRVLLVEDNPMDRLLLQEMLHTSKSALFQLTHVEYLSEALQQLAVERFDVVLLDLSLPDSLGLATFTMLRAQALAVPVVVLTGLNKVTLSSIGDTVIATDIQGTIIFTNPVAARLTGWPSHEAVGRHIHEIFRLVNAQTRQAVENPVIQVLREGTAVAWITIRRSLLGTAVRYQLPTAGHRFAAMMGHYTAWCWSYGMSLNTNSITFWQQYSVMPNWL
jgi:CheY-like chemotaxis protein